MPGKLPKGEDHGGNLSGHNYGEFGGGNRKASRRGNEREEVAPGQKNLGAGKTRKATPTLERKKGSGKETIGAVKKAVRNRPLRRGKEGYRACNPE